MVPIMWPQPRSFTGLSGILQGTPYLAISPTKRGISVKSGRSGGTKVHIAAHRRILAHSSCDSCILRVWFDLTARFSGPGSGGHDPSVCSQLPVAAISTRKHRFPSDQL